jgi:hypothetical protein
MAISRKYGVESITKEILKLAKGFGFLTGPCIQIKSDVADYIVLAQARGNWDGREFCKEYTSIISFFSGAPKQLGYLRVKQKKVSKVVALLAAGNT